MQRRENATLPQPLFQNVHNVPGALLQAVTWLFSAVLSRMLFRQATPHSAVPPLTLPGKDEMTIKSRKAMWEYVTPCVQTVATS